MDGRRWVGTDGVILELFDCFLRQPQPPGQGEKLSTKTAFQRPWTIFPYKGNLGHGRGALAWGLGLS